jgi:hypothetical protein
MDPGCPGVDCPSQLGDMAVFGTYDAIAGGANAAIYGGCLAVVEAGAADQCDAEGGPVAMTAGLCSDASQTPEFAGACAAYGGAQALIATCMQLGFTAEDCASAGTLGMGAVAAYCADVFDDGSNVTCDDVGYGECDVLTNLAFADGLCFAVATALTTSETCGDWAAGLAESALNDNAAAVIGMSCSEAAQNYVDGCIEGDTSNEDTEFHVMDPRFAAWGGFFTTGAASCFGTCGALAGAGIPGMVNADGSPSDACLYADLTPYGATSCSIDSDGDGYNDTIIDDSKWNLSAADPSAGGRLTFHYDATCLRVVEVHEVNIDFTDITGQCHDFGDNANPGDVDNSCADPFNTSAEQDICVNVNDIVLMVQAILGTQLEFQELCRGDIDGNGLINVVDVVQTIQIILGSVIDATSTEIIKTDNAVQYTADGVVGAFQFTINHDEDFSIELTENAFIADYKTNGTQTTVVIVMPETVDLFTVNGDFEIIEVLAANSNGLIESNVVLPENFKLSNAYPNPFNPSTSLLLNLDQDGIVAVKVFNINGQLVDLLTEGNMNAGMHTITWDAQEFASGIYFIKAYIGSEVIIQKVSLMK